MVELLRELRRTRGMTALGILRLVATLRAKNVKIRPSLGITTKSDFVFAQPRPEPDMSNLSPEQQCSEEFTVKRKTLAGSLSHTRLKARHKITHGRNVWQRL